MTRMKNTPMWAMTAVVVALGLSSGATASAQKNDSVPLEKIYANTAKSFVIVDYYLKKSDRPRPEDGSGLYDRAQRSVLQHVLNKNTVSVVGVVIGDKGDVLTMEDPVSYRDDVAKITVTGFDGTVVPAQAARLLVKAPGSVIRITEAMPKTWEALKFADLAEVTSDTSLYAATLRGDEREHIYVRPCEYGDAWRQEGGPSRYLRVSSTSDLAVLCDAEGRPVGATVSREIDLGSGGPIWRGKDILADEGIPADQQSQLEDRLEKEFARSIYEVKIVFRPQPQEDERSSGGRYAYSERAGNQERLVYGLGFVPDKLLLPEAMSREAAAGIDTVTVKVDGKQVPARFGGVLKQCNATVIELGEGQLPHTAAFVPDGCVARMEPFWTVFVREMAGMDVLVRYSRWITKEQGYADRWYAVPERPVWLGSWLVDRQGRLVGFSARARHEEDRLARYLMGDTSGRSGGYAPSSAPRLAGGSSYSAADTPRLFDAAELAPILANLSDNYDPHIRYLSKEEQKRRVWLGVEYTRPSKEMVKQMDLRHQTQDGRIGLMVNRVYAGSPAAKLGVMEGDVLLKIAVPGAPWPVDLATDERPTYDVSDADETDVPGEFQAMGYRTPRRRPWPSRDNYLTRMLAEIGAGTTVKLTYVHDGQTLEKEFTIELSPPDMLSAGRYKNEKLGLTVKDMTYEIRAALHLSDTDAAVVITDVEQGTPAALARINTYELIRAVDGQQVDNVQTLEKLIADAQVANKESVRLTVEWMGKTRLADLKFNARANVPAGPRSLVPGGANSPDQ